MTSEKEVETGPRTRDPRMWATIKSDGDPIGRLQKQAGEPGMCNGYSARALATLNG